MKIFPRFLFDKEGDVGQKRLRTTDLVDVRLMVYLRVKIEYLIPYVYCIIPNKGSKL